MYPTGPTLNANSQAQAQTLASSAIATNSSSSSNYLIGNDHTKWLTNIPNYNGVIYKNIYPGIDLSYYGTQNNLEHDFIVSPQADPSQIALVFDGITSLQLDSNTNTGGLLISNGSNQLKLAPPDIYQLAKGVEHKVSGSYMLKSGNSGNQLSFQIGTYDHTLPLIIDHILAYPTYLGGSGADSGRAIAVDSVGNVYIAGYTGSSNFTTTTGVIQNTRAASFDTFVTKLNPTGTAPIFSTYLGGNANDYAYGLAVDASSNVYIAGATQSTDFPTTTGALQTTLKGTTNAFVAKLNSTGTALSYST
jgi:hypothetical protein